MNQREKCYDMLKGLAIILIVLGHVIRGLNDSGVIIPHFWLVDKVIYSIHLPIFFIVSGILYSFKSNKRPLVYSIKKVLLSLYVPYFIFIYLFWFLKFVILKDNDVLGADFLSLFYSGKWIFWFLLSLLLIKIIYIINDYFTDSHLFLYFLFLIIFGINMNVDVTLCKWLSYGLFFSIGNFIKEHDKIYNTKPLIAFYLLCIFVGLLLFKCNTYINMLFLGTPICILLLCLLKSNRKLNNAIITKLGTDSMVIYLLHTIITSLCRIVLFKVGITSICIHIICGTLISILICEIYVYIYTNIKLFNFLEYIIYPLKSKKINKLLGKGE